MSSPIAAIRSGPGCCWRIISRNFPSRARISAQPRMVAARSFQPAAKSGSRKPPFFSCALNRPAADRIAGPRQLRRFAEIEQAEKEQQSGPATRAWLFPSSPAHLDAPRASIRVACEAQARGRLRPLRPVGHFLVSRNRTGEKAKTRGRSGGFDHPDRP